MGTWGGLSRIYSAAATVPTAFSGRAGSLSYRDSARTSICANGIAFNVELLGNHPFRTYGVPFVYGRLYVRCIDELCSTEGLASNWTDAAVVTHPSVYQLPLEEMAVRRLNGILQWSPANCAKQLSREICWHLGPFAPFLLATALLR